jgi:hypothetical protein
MNSVLIGVDFAVNGDDVSFLEMNTDINISKPVVNYFDFTALFNYISSNNFTKLHLIYKKDITAVEFINEMKLYCTNNSITYNETLTPTFALFIPDVESDDETLVIRLSFNSQAILDDLYCRDKSELIKLVFDNELTKYIPKTYSKYNDNVTISDNLNTLNDNGINPNLIVKNTLPSSQNTFPKFHKLSTPEELANLKANLGESTILQEYIYNTENIIDSTIVNHVRSWFLVSNGLSDIVDCGSYVGANSVQIEENLVTYTNNELDNVARAMYFSNPKLSSGGIPSDYIVKVLQNDNSFQNTIVGNIQIGDVIEVVNIATLDTNLPESETQNWSYTGSLNELITYTTASVVGVGSINVNNWFYRVNYTNGSSLLSKDKKVLVESSGTVSFKPTSYLEVGDTIFNSSTEFSVVSQISMEYYIGLMVDIDIEPSDVYIAGNETNEIMNTILVHNNQIPKT